MSDVFGERDPRKMPRHFFWGSLSTDYATAVKADVSRQNYSICPRYWYIDERINDNRKLLAKQLARHRESEDG